MKIFLLLLVCYSSMGYSQSRFHELAFESSDKEMISLSGYAGTRVLIAVGSPSFLKKNGMELLHSVSKQYPQLKILVFPAEDLAVDSLQEDLGAVQKDSSAQISIAAMSVTKKESAQQPVLKFLTDAKENSHFDEDINNDFQLYVINESGVLFAVLEKDFPLKLLNEVLQQKDFKE